MADQTSGSQTGQSNPQPVTGESPGGRPMGALGVTLITVYLVAVTIVVFHSLVVLWPPIQQGIDDDTRVILERLDKLEKAQSAGPQTAAEEAGATEEATASTVAAAGTTEPLGSDLEGESSGTDFTGSMGTDLEGGSGSAASAGKDEDEEFIEGEKCADGEQVRAKLFWCLELCLADEERLFLIVMFAGALGGLVHTLRSFYWYAGCRRLVSSWTGFYITLPILGATMATVFYLVVRGGFFSPQSEISDTSPFGFAALAALIGMFTEQAAEKLKEITETLFATAPKGTDDAGPEPAAPTVESVAPDQGPQAGGTAVTIAGTGFAQGATVRFGGKDATDIQVASGGTSITATTPAATELGPVPVEVANTDGQKGSLANGYTYV